MCWRWLLMFACINSLVGSGGYRALIWAFAVYDYRGIVVMPTCLLATLLTQPAHGKRGQEYNRREGEYPTPV